MPERLTEAEANERFRTRDRLKSHGDYGCHVLVFRADEPEVASREGWLWDEHFRSLWNTFSPDKDIGTIIIDGDVHLDAEANISDRLLCLVVTGNLIAKQFHIFETEVTVFGDCRAEFLTDHDGYLHVLGDCDVDTKASYDD